MRGEHVRHHLVPGEESDVAARVLGPDVTVELDGCIDVCVTQSPRCSWGASDSCTATAPRSPAGPSSRCGSGCRRGSSRRTAWPTRHPCCPWPSSRSAMSSSSSCWSRTSFLDGELVVRDQPRGRPIGHRGPRGEESRVGVQTVLGRQRGVARALPTTRRGGRCRRSPPRSASASRSGRPRMQPEVAKAQGQARPVRLLAHGWNPHAAGYRGSVYFSEVARRLYCNTTPRDDRLGHHGW